MKAYSLPMEVDGGKVIQLSRWIITELIPLGEQLFNNMTFTFCF